MRCWPDNAAPAEAAGAGMGRAVSRPLLYRAAARRARRATRPTCSARCALAARLKLAGGGDAPGAVPHARRFKAHEARVCISQGYMLADQRRPRCSRREQYFKTQAEMAQLFADLPAALANSVEIAKRCNFELELGKSRLPPFPDARRHAGLDDYLRRQARAGLERAPGAALSRRAASARAQAPRYRERLELEIDTIIKMGFAGLLPDRGRLHQLGQAQRRAGRPGPRLGRGLAGRLHARHHRPRSAALRPAVRALPQSRARVDARLRHRLLPGRARPRHRVRAQEVRQRQRVADRDLRHHGGEGRGARRRARAGHAATTSATSSPS